MTTPMLSARLLGPSVIRMPLRSRRRSRLSAWPAFAAAGSILALLALAGCRAAPPVVISADREIVHMPDGKYAVTETWLMERYELERALRLRAETCEGAK